MILNYLPSLPVTPMVPACARGSERDDDDHKQSPTSHQVVAQAPSAGRRRLQIGRCRYGRQPAPFPAVDAGQQGCLRCQTGTCLRLQRLGGRGRPWLHRLRGAQRLLMWCACGGRVGAWCLRRLRLVVTGRRRRAALHRLCWLRHPLGRLSWAAVHQSLGVRARGLLHWWLRAWLLWRQLRWGAGRGPRLSFVRLIGGAGLRWRWLGVLWCRCWRVLPGARLVVLPGGGLLTVLPLDGVARGVGSAWLGLLLLLHLHTLQRQCMVSDCFGKCLGKIDGELPSTMPEAPLKPTALTNLTAVNT